MTTTEVTFLRCGRGCGPARATPARLSKLTPGSALITVIWCTYWCTNPRRSCAGSSLLGQGAAARRGCGEVREGAEVLQRLAARDPPCPLAADRGPEADLQHRVE
jgi:hypothetical protein